MSSCPVLHLPEHVMLEHFNVGLNKSLTSQLDASSKGSFSHLSVSQGKETLGRMLRDRSFTTDHEPPLEERTPEQWAVLVAKTNSPPSTSANPALEGPLNHQC
jgi:hypothetical protein